MPVIWQILWMIVPTRAQDTTVISETDSQGGWYTHPVWTGVGIVVLVLILMLIRRVDRRRNTPTP